MAKRKSVSISRKPTAEREAPIQPDIPARDEPDLLDAMLDPPAGPVYRADRRGDPAPPAPDVPPGPLGKLVYGTVYGISYSVVFTAILLGKLIPGGALVGRGLRDGAASAGQRFEAKPERRADFASAKLRA